MKIRVHHLLLAAILVLPTVVIGLRGTHSQNAAYQVNGLQTATSVEGVGLGLMLWSDNFTDAMWYLSSSNTTQPVFSQKGSLDLNGTFIEQTTAQAVTISRNINLSLDQNPVVFTQLVVSKGVHYGLRFSGVTPDGTSFDAWNENSPLQHRPGLALWENVSTNLRLQTYLTNDQIPVPGSRITHLWLYIEATAGTRGIYSMKISSIKAFPLVSTEFGLSAVSGNFLGVEIDLNLPSPTQSIFQAYVDFNIRGSSTLKYTPFLLDRTIVIAQGFDYVLNSVTSYESAVLSPTLVSGFPNFLPERGDTTMIIATSSGSISQFKLANLTVKYTSTPIQSAGYVDPTVGELMIVYYLLFLFVTPVAAIILVVKVFKAEA